MVQFSSVQFSSGLALALGLGLGSTHLDEVIILQIHVFTVFHITKLLPCGKVVATGRRMVRMVGLQAYRWLP